MNEQMKNHQSRIDELRNQIDILHQELRSEIEKLDKESEAELSATEPDLATMMQCHHNGVSSTFMYNKIHEFCAQYRDDGIFGVSGFYPETDQRTICIYVNKNWDDEKLQKMADVLENEFLPVIKPVNGKKTLSIMSQDLSAHGVLELTIHDGLYIIEKTVYGHTKDWYTSDTLMGALRNMTKYAWYRKNDN